ncbi:MAG: zinc ribbon domain-containing protein [Oscillospiraceae bacterium]|nr:zinc ribbon domain-containing protein [Oscillospiraceae bacterium]
MKYCMHCGNPLPDDAHFCEHCGAASPAAASEEPSPAAEEAREERACLDNMRRMLRGEQLSWTIGTWVTLGVSLLYMLLWVLFVVAATTGLPMDHDDRVFFGMVCTIFLIYVAVLIGPRIVVGFIMASRSKAYMQNIYERPEEAIERCGHAGIIVLGAIFNEVALIFIIINFVRCKSRRKVFDRIVAQRRGL